MNLIEGPPDVRGSPRTKKSQVVTQSRIESGNHESAGNIVVPPAHLIVGARVKEILGCGGHPKITECLGRNLHQPPRLFSIHLKVPSQGQDHPGLASFCIDQTPHFFPGN